MPKLTGFLGFPDRLTDIRPRAVIFGAGHGSTYPGEDDSSHASAPDAIRQASQIDSALIENWDFDLDGPLFKGDRPCCIDVGNLPTVSHNNAENRFQIEAKTREILNRQAVPLLLGGDDSVPIPFLAAFTDFGPIWIVQIDAHIDWLEERDGEQNGYSSPMRRASEMNHVAGMVQIGMRGVGSATQSEVEAALCYGSHIVSARDVHTQGIAAALTLIPKGAQVVVTLDCDGLDPSIMPGVSARTPGGLTYLQTVDLISGVGKRGAIVGFSLVEYRPLSDVDGVTALTAARILVNAIGTVVRQERP